MLVEQLLKMVEGSKNALLVQKNNFASVKNSYHNLRILRRHPKNVYLLVKVLYEFKLMAHCINRKLLPE